MDFAQGGFWQAAAQRRIEAFDAGGQESIRRSHGEAAPDDGDVRGDIEVGRADIAVSTRAKPLAGRRGQALGQRSLDLRDLAAQGKNSLPRHG